MVDIFDEKSICGIEYSPQEYVALEDYRKLEAAIAAALERIAELGAEIERIKSDPDSYDAMYKRNGELQHQVVEAGERERALREVLEIMVKQEVDFMLLNNLGDPEQQHGVILARAALAVKEGWMNKIKYDGIDNMDEKMDFIINENGTLRKRIEELESEIKDRHEAEQVALAELAKADDTSAAAQERERVLREKAKQAKQWIDGGGALKHVSRMLKAAQSCESE